jgi:hypothetical protein
MGVPFNDLATVYRDRPEEPSPMARLALPVTQVQVEPDCILPRLGETVTLSPALTIRKRP